MSHMYIQIRQDIKKLPTRKSWWSCTISRIDSDSLYVVQALQGPAWNIDNFSNSSPLGIIQVGVVSMTNGTIKHGKIKTQKKTN